MAGRPGDRPPVSGRPADRPPVAGRPAYRPPVSGRPADRPLVSGRPVDRPPVAGRPLTDNTSGVRGIIMFISASYPLRDLYPSNTNSILQSIPPRTTYVGITHHAHTYL